MKYGMIVKIAIFVAILVVANALLGVVCGRAYRQYEALFFPGPELLNLAIWAFGTMALVAVAAGLLVALVRPFWVIIVSFVLSALAMILAWEMSIVSVALGLVYVVLAIVYARSIVGELNNRLNFSVHPIGEGQGVLLLALVLLVSISFALGYREDAMRRGFIVPPAYKQTVMAMIFPRLQALIESRSELRPEEKAVALEQARQGVEQFWAKIETMLQPYAQFIPVGLALLLGCGCGPPATRRGRLRRASAPLPARPPPHER
ncbi:MAG: hypothetical protein HY871_06365, partial [Chloroflexi bacterium]|nr:hypothetical protein [Chloroflexota bacterium]